MLSRFRPVWCIQDVCDLPPGSGAAAAATLALGTSYSGFTRTKEHASWQNLVLDQAHLAILSDGDTKEAADEKKVTTDILSNIRPVMDEARRFFRAEALKEEDDKAEQDSDSEST